MACQEFAIPRPHHRRNRIFAVQRQPQLRRWDGFNDVNGHFQRGRLDRARLPGVERDSDLGRALAGIVRGLNQAL
jgi:hypothetical protein